MWREVKKYLYDGGKLDAVKATTECHLDRRRTASEQDELLPGMVRAKPANHRRGDTGLSRQSPLYRKPGRPGSLEE